MKKTQAKKKTASASRAPARKEAPAKKPAAPARSSGAKRAAPVAPKSAAQARSPSAGKSATRSSPPMPVASVRAATKPPVAASKKPEAAPLPIPKNRHFDKAVVERAAKLILKVCKPLVADDDDSDAEAQRNRLALENAHPRRRPDGEYEVFLRYSAGSGLQDPESEAESHARTFFLKNAEFSGVPVAVDVTVLEERES